MKIYITDKSGKKFWNTLVSFAYAEGERRNLKRHLASIKAGHPAYAACCIDMDSARIVEELDQFDERELERALS